MTFAAVAGTGDPNEEGGAYSRALELLYAFSYAVKMSKKGTWQPAVVLRLCRAAARGPVVGRQRGLRWGVHRRQERAFLDLAHPPARFRDP